MGWKEARKRYKDGNSLSDQKVEDLVARRVLRGLGVKEKQLPGLEKRIFGNVDFDDALWVRTKRVLDWSLNHSKYTHLIKHLDFEVLGIVESKADKEVLERLEMVRLEDLHKPVFFVRLKNGVVSLAYSIWAKDRIGVVLKPPYTVVAEHDDMHVAVQPTSEFVQQFELQVAVKELLHDPDY